MGLSMLHFFILFLNIVKVISVFIKLKYLNYVDHCIEDFIETL